ncbi:MAG: Sulfur carrier protein FdhD [Burkholderiaceae bacterium]|jgi:FdhD protein|nr:MAG: Sulfur carrier protein FdhD [Burkholderiaceae bacterium]
MASKSATPRLTQARAPLTREIEVLDEYGRKSVVSIPAERALTVYVDRRELVTLMTLGAEPELLVLGYLRNQRLIAGPGEVDSITVDWEVGAAAVKTRAGIRDLARRTARRVVTTGCGQGSVFGALMDDLDKIRLPASVLTQRELYALVDTIRLQETTYKSAGSVHGCALFEVRGGTPRMLIFIEDVGRHNAIDTIAGWMWLHDAPAPDGAMDRGARVFYTTGRLTSEMVIKSAQMGVAIVVSRSGITQMGHELAERLGLCTIGRATNKRFVCYSAQQRLALEPLLAGAPPAPAAPRASGSAAQAH